MFKKILMAVSVFLALAIATPMAGKENLPKIDNGIYISPKAHTKVHPRTSGGWEKIEVNEYDVAVIWVTDQPEAYYIVDARANLCFFNVSTVNGISTTRVPCKPFMEKIDKLDDRFDSCR